MYEDKLARSKLLEFQDVPKILPPITKVSNQYKKVEGAEGSTL
jgi:hypothetical protein